MSPQKIYYMVRRGPTRYTQSHTQREHLMDDNFCYYYLDGGGGAPSFLGLAKKSEWIHTLPTSFSFKGI